MISRPELIRDLFYLQYHENQAMQENVQSLLYFEKILILLILSWSSRIQLTLPSKNDRKVVNLLCAVSICYLSDLLQMQKIFVQF